MNELIAYFVKMGMSPEVAVQIATQVSKTAPPTPPIANGIKLNANDAVENLLTTRYRMNPHQAFAYAGRVLAGTATASRPLQEEALTALGEQEQARLKGMRYNDALDNGLKMAEGYHRADKEQVRLHNISNFVEAARVKPENRTPEQKSNYDFVDDWSKQKMREEADHNVADDAADTAVYNAKRQKQAEYDRDYEKYQDDEAQRRLELNRKLGPVPRID